MGWGSAGYKIFDPVATGLQEAGASDELKERVLTNLISTLQHEDWDTELDSLQGFLDDPAIVKAFASNGVRWDTSGEG